MADLEKALAVTRGLGLPDQEVIPLYQNLLKVYKDNLELLEDENYQVLVDAFFEQKDENKEGEDMSMESGKPAKRLFLAGKEERRFPKLDHSSKKSISKESKTPSTSSRLQLIKPSKPCASKSKCCIIPPQPRNKVENSNSIEPSKPCASESKYRLVPPQPRNKVENLNSIEPSKPRASESKYQLVPPHPRNKVENSNSFNDSSGVRVKKYISLSTPPAVKSFDRLLGEPSSHVSRENNNFQKNLLPKPSTEKQLDDSPISARPISVIHPELQNPPHKIGYSEINVKKPSRCENGETHPLIHDKSKVQKRPAKLLPDISKGTEKMKVSLLDEVGNENFPKFNYIPQSIIYQNANINISLARVVDEDCCSSCSGNCLSSPLPCACARETGGEFAYTPQGLLKEEFLRACIDMKEKPQEHHFVYCTDCPIERSRNEDNFEKCKGHLVRKFIKECWRKCGCDMHCGNRVVQRGISSRLQVFFTREGKGWGVRSLDPLPKGAFVCEYIGEVLTNMELYNRNKKGSNDRHTYPVTLDADWGSEGFLKDEEALCLDGTYHGNVSRFINHRCSDPNLVDIPVEVETPDRHYYHLAFFTTRKVAAFEELTWDYGIDFDDKYHPIKAFRCCCGSPNCRDRTRKRKQV
ncbi:histone-lysine N-methyltransferase SUVR4 [Humulus lupulus]|uniref:histone-lysine N-methyltransferase SUVR4 n=1 Tax=Humulus lupulus TaxID=3486 RepID=UPI002B415A98|nr:histone-lysine N-methyltransferase SUVR4 [Humulus lupulus]XP_062084359.1 histone-lysine N-methyltransferase SUVR4 [Humulus lupulus]